MPLARQYPPVGGDEISKSVTSAVKCQRSCAVLDKIGYVDGIQYHYSVLGECNRVFIVSSKSSVDGLDSPAVRLLSHLVCSRTNHRLYRYRHSAKQSLTPSGTTVVRYIRLLMKLAPHAVTDIPSHGRETVLGNIAVDSGTDIPYSASVYGCSGDTAPEGILCYGNKPCSLLGDLADRKGRCAVAGIAIVKSSDIDLNDVPLLQYLIDRGYSVDNFVIYRDTRTARKSTVTEKCGLCPALLDIAANDSVYLMGGYAGLCSLAARQKCLSGNLSGISQTRDLCFIF